MEITVQQSGQPFARQNRPTVGQLPSIIYPPTIDWHFLFQRPQQLMSALARLGYRAFFCNTSPGYNQRNGITRLDINLYLVSGANPSQLAGVDPILWISYPPHLHLLPRYRPGLVVFDAVDEPVEEFAHWAKDVASLRARADVVFASSQSLYETHKEHHPNVHLCPNGADFAHFARAVTEIAVPLDLARIPRPIIGYHGALADWIDWELVEATASAHLDLSFVFIGPMYSGDERMPTGPNLFYLGHRDYRFLPNYLHGFDVGIIPFRLSPLTLACNPIKLWEYLAAGIPVVATPLPEVELYPEVKTACDAVTFGGCLRAALAEGKSGTAAMARQALARDNSWDARALQIHEVLTETKRKRVHHEDRSVPVPTTGIGGGAYSSSH